VRFKLKGLPDYSRSALLDEIRRVAALFPNGALTRKLFDEHGRASASKVIREFGGWEAALVEAGLSHRYRGPPVSERMRSQPGREIGKAEALAELRRVAEVCGASGPTVEQFNKHGKFSAWVIQDKFESWPRALVAAGLTPQPTAARWTEVECFENLLEVWTDLGRQPKHREMSQPPSRIRGKVYERRWGSWRSALEAFVAYAEQDAAIEQKESAAPIRAASAEPSPRSEEDVRRVRLGLHYQVLSRDRFRCVLCGNSPELDPLCRLHVEHIFPFSRGGRTVIENLRTLCEPCNLGKGDRVESME